MEGYKVANALMLLLALLASSCSSDAGGPDNQPMNVAGRWNVEQYFLENTAYPEQQPFSFAVYEWQLTQAGNTVSGTIASGPRTGTITGTLSGNTFTGTMHLQFDPVAYRELTLQFSANSATGTALYAPPASTELHRYRMTLNRGAP
ncbi:MAG TPA: hypothetical protein VGD27_17335 [Longimicrobiales bacterium]